MNTIHEFEPPKFKASLESQTAQVAPDTTELPAGRRWGWAGPQCLCIPTEWPNQEVKFAVQVTRQNTQQGRKLSTLHRLPAGTKGTSVEAGMLGNQWNNPEGGRPLSQEGLRRKPPVTPELIRDSAPSAMGGLTSVADANS